MDHNDDILKRTQPEMKCPLLGEKDNILPYTISPSHRCGNRWILHLLEILRTRKKYSGKSYLPLYHTRNKTQEITQERTRPSAALEEVFPFC
jgi:hypothetical protein